MHSNCMYQARIQDSFPVSPSPSPFKMNSVAPSKFCSSIVGCLSENSVVFLLSIGVFFLVYYRCIISVVLVYYQCIIGALSVYYWCSIGVLSV